MYTVYARSGKYTLAVEWTRSMRCGAVRCGAVLVMVVVVVVGVVVVCWPGAPSIPS